MWPRHQFFEGHFECFANSLSDTIITSFPQEWGHVVCTKAKCVGMRERIEAYLHDSNRKALESVHDLAAVIVNECISVFGDFQIPEIEFRFLDLFDASISDIVSSRV
jgi:hypothetical protein